jgi:hypothetical protein
VSPSPHIVTDAEGVTALFAEREAWAELWAAVAREAEHESKEEGGESERDAA